MNCLAGRPSFQDAEHTEIYTRRRGMHRMVQRHSPGAHTFSQRTQRPGNNTLAAHHHPRYSTEQSEELSSPGALLGKTEQAAVKNHCSLHSPGQLTAQPPAPSFLCLVEHSCPRSHRQGARVHQNQLGWFSTTDPCSLSATPWWHFSHRKSCD